MRMTKTIMAMTIAFSAAGAMAQATPAPATDSGPYKVINTVKVGGAGSWDYCYADADGRKLYIPRTGRGTAARVTVYDLDSLQSVGEIPNTNGVHGVAIDTKSGHGFCSSNPVVMFDTKTLATIKTIDVQGSPDGILFDPATERVFVLSHRAPNVTVINAADGTIAGTIDLGGSPEEAATDGAGHVYIDIEDGDNVAAVDANTMKVLAHYDISSKGGGPGGLAMDAKNHILFAMCHDPQTCVILNADDGKILATLPIGNGVDAAEFNPNTLEAFSSQGDGTLTVIKEDSPTSFEVEQNVATKRGARTSTLDTKTNQIYLITADYAPSTRPAAAASTQPAGDQAGRGGGRGGRGGGRGQMVPDSFTILVVGH
jgi:DNA-binding beta-propeller fold protein YncE